MDLNDLYPDGDEFDYDRAVRTALETGMLAAMVLGLSGKPELLGRFNAGEIAGLVTRDGLHLVPGQPVPDWPWPEIIEP